MTRLACLATVTIVFSGCQQMAWKPGASPADLDRDTVACEAGNAEQQAVHDCLRKRGWVVRVPKRGEEGPVEDAEAAVAIGAGVPPATAAAPAMPGIGAAAAAVSAPAEPGPPEPGMGTAPAPRNKSVPQASSFKPADPLRLSNVQAWWKMGGQSDALNADMDACVGQLGPEHRPDLQNRLYTRGLIDCLKGKGWFGR
jgi:hypothetical protein